jgi:hypothetical protein
MEIRSRIPADPVARAAFIALWGERAEMLLERALDELRDGDDAIPTISAAEACLRIQDGQLDAAELSPSWYGEYDGPQCTCPPEMTAAGGFSSSCPACGNGGYVKP